MHTEIRAYHAMASRDILARLALQRASIMHLVDLKRGGYSPCRIELRIDRLTDRPIARARAAPTILSTARTFGRPLPEGQPSPNEDVLINMEAFRGAIRKGDWKLMMVALLPGKDGAL
jgi:hypothetical protein